MTNSVARNQLNPQSGNEKQARRAQWQKSHASKKFDHEKHRRKNESKEWITKYRKDVMEKKNKQIHQQYSPHSGVESSTLDLLKKHAELLGTNITQDTWSKLEGVILLAASLSECTSYTQALSIFLLYLKTHYTQSLVESASESFKELFEESEVVPHAGKPIWLDNLREGLLDWRLIVSNPSFKKISYLISICITLGLCDAASFEWRVQNVKVFSIPALEKHYGAFDLIDAAIETVVYFVEGGYACFKSGSLTPFMYSDHQAREFDEEYGFLVANLEHVKTGNLQRLRDMDDHAFDVKLTDTLKLAHDLYTSAKGTWEKKIFYDRLSRLRQIRTTFDSIRVQGGLRIAPFTMNFYGKSGVGKSSVSAISMVIGLLSNGFAASDEMLATLNESDKFMSNYKSYINGIFLDDVGNTKPDFVEKSPTNKIIEICNNVRQYANVAEADMKGKVSIEPKFVNITTNVKSLCANTYSKEPVSIARRAHLTVTVTVKPEFCTSGLAGSVGQQLDSSKVDAFYTDEDGFVNVPVVPDLWLLTVERVVPVAREIGADAIAYEPFVHNGKELINVSIHEFLDFMIDHSKAHFVQQENLVKRSNNLSQQIPMCRDCKRPQSYCKCVIEPHGGVVGYALGVVGGQIVSNISGKVVKILQRESSILERMATSELVLLAKDLEYEIMYNWTNWVPSSLLKCKYGRPFIHYAMRDSITQTIRRESFSWFVLGVCTWLFTLFFSVFWLPVACFITYRTAGVVETVKERVYQEIVERNDSMPDVFKKVRDKQIKYVLGALGAFGALYTLLKVWQGFRTSNKVVHGSLHPLSKEDVDERDAEVNPWNQVEIEPLPFVQSQITVTPDEAVNLIFKNQVYLRVPQHDGNRVCGAVFMKSNIMIMPYHMWFVDANTSSQICDRLEVQFTRGEEGRTGCVFRAILSLENMCRIGSTDFALVYVPNSCSYRDITKFLPVEDSRGGFSTMVFRDGHGHKVIANANVKMGLVGHREHQFYGGSYDLSIPTFNGLCMGTFVSRGKVTHIIGFHLGGKTNTAQGILGFLSLNDFLSAECELRKRDSVLLTKSEGTLPTEMYGKKYFLGSEVHPKSPVNFLQGDTNLRVFGQVTGQVTPHSSVVPTVITDTVHEVCGVPQQWGPPKMRPTWKPFQESLMYSANPSIGVGCDKLSWAVRDYVAPIQKLITEHDWLHENVKPLSRMETICGVDGLRFIDKMKPNTSCGFPLTGSKKQFLTLLDPDLYPGHAYPQELDSQFWEEFDRIKSCYLRGERAHLIFKACLKDEPTPLIKEKVRVFQAAPIALQLMVRMYFLPIARVLSLYPLVSECAVGINSQGPEWNALQEHITKFGKDRILAGDYSKYDLRMPAEITLAAFKVFIILARASGNYSEEDISIMEGVATDICYPTVAFNGTLLQLIGSNPSGQNLTVYVNSIGNSLLLRCGFYHITSRDQPRIWAQFASHEKEFRQIAAMGTYGDDVKGSVRKGFDFFNHISYAQFLSEHDMKFTMPDKESTPTEFMRDEDADFLKRKNIWCEEVQMYFGALDEQSIFKSLHSVLRSDFLTSEEQAMANIDGAMREWFAYGRDVYEKRRSQLTEIANRHGFVCTELNVSYDDRMTTWKVKYLGEDTEE